MQKCQSTKSEQIKNFFLTVVIWIMTLLVTMAFQQAIDHSLEQIPNVNDPHLRAMVYWGYALSLLCAFSALAWYYKDFLERTNQVQCFSIPSVVTVPTAPATSELTPLIQSRNSPINY